MAYNFGGSPDSYARARGTLQLEPGASLTVTDATTGNPVTNLRDKDGAIVSGGAIVTDSDGEYEFSCDSAIVVLAGAGRTWKVASIDGTAMVLDVLPEAEAIAGAAQTSAIAAEASRVAAVAAQAAAEAAVAGGGSTTVPDGAVTLAKLSATSPAPGKVLGVSSGGTALSWLSAPTAGTTSSTFAAGDDGRFASTAAAAASAAAAAALALTAATEPVVYVATATATAGQKALATSSRVLPASGVAGLATAIKDVLEGNKRVQFLGPVGGILDLDAPLVAVAQDGYVWDFGGIALRVHAGENNGGGSGQAGIILGGGPSVPFNGTGGNPLAPTGLPTTLGQGIDTISHTSSAFGTAMPAGTWLHLTSTENRNPNRPAEFFKGEICRTLSNSSTSWVLSNPLRDSYAASTLTVRSVPMVTGLEIRNLSIIGNPSTSGGGPFRQNGLVVRNVAGLRMSNIYVTGVELADGLGIWGCIGYDVQGRSYMVQDRYGPGVQGYGLRLAGSEGGTIDWDGELDRHAVDLGMSSSQWPVTRHTLIRRVRARYCYAAGFAIHDAEFTNTTSGAVQVLSCGGGIIIRGSYTRLLRPVILGGQAVTYPWGAAGVSGGSGTQSTGAGISVGERTKLTLSAFDDTSANGLGGVGLEIIEPVIDLRGATGDFDGISVEDPLQGALITVTTPIRARRTGFRFMGDSISDSVVRIAVDHTTGTGGTGSYGPPSGTVYTGVTLTGSTGTFDLGSGTPPSVGTELISTGGTPASSTPAGWGGFVPGGTYFVYSVSGTTFKVASRKSGNTAPITFTQDLTGLSFIAGQRVHSAFIVPSVSSVNPQFIRRSTIAITSTACRDVPVVIAGARNGGVSFGNKLSVTVTSLGSGPTSSTPVIRWVGTSCGEWNILPVDASPHLRSALHSAYTGLTTAAGGPTLTYVGGIERSRFSDGSCSLSAPRGTGRPRPAAGRFHTRDYFGSVTATALVVGDIGVVRAFPVRVIDRIIGGIRVGVGTVPVLNLATYLRLRLAVFADSGDGITPLTTKLADLGTIDLVTGAANTDRTFTLSTPLWDGAWDVAGSGVYHLGYVVQADGTAGSQITTFPTIPFASNVTMSDPSDTFSNVSGRGWSSSNTQLTDAGSLGAVSAWNRDASARALPFLVVDSTTPAGMA